MISVTPIILEMNKVKGCADVVSIYNTYLVQLLSALKEVDTKSRESVRAVLRLAGVKAIDHESTRYINLSSDSESILGTSTGTGTDTDTYTDTDTDGGEADVTILPGVHVSMLVEGVTGGAKVARPFVALLQVLSATYRAGDDSLATQAVRAISAIQSGAKDAPAHVAAVFDDDVQSRLRSLQTILAQCAPLPHGTDGPGSDTDLDLKGNAFIKAMEGSSIGTIAKEIMEEMADSDLLNDIEADPGNISIAGLLDPTSKLGSIAKLVGAKLQDQLGSGKLDHSKLMGEVMSMFGDLGEGGAMAGGPGGGVNPLLSQVMKMAQQMGANMGAGPTMPPAAPAGGERGATARARLQDRLARRAGNN